MYRPIVEGEGLAATIGKLYNLRPVPKIVQPSVVSIAQPTKIKKGFSAGEVNLPVVEGYAPEFSLKGILDRYLHNLNTDVVEEVPVILGGERKQGRFHPSEICKEDACQRAMAYELFCAPEAFSVDAKLRRIFDNGHFVHARLQYYCKKALATVGGKFYEEIGFRSKQDRTAGTTDGGIILSGWPYLLEIKSMNKANFKDLGALPWDEHYDQVNIYMHYLKVGAAFVVVECKDNQEIREYFVRYDEQRWNRVAAVQQQVLGYVTASQLPPTITKEAGCSERCKFYGICKGARQKTWKLPRWETVCNKTWEKEEQEAA